MSSRPWIDAATPISLLETLSNKDKEWNTMYYLDYRLGKILSDIRIEHARQIRQRKLSKQSRDRNKQRLGLWLIARGENQANSRQKAA